MINNKAIVTIKPFLPTKVYCAYPDGSNIYSLSEIQHQKEGCDCVFPQPGTKQPFALFKGMFIV